MSWGTVHSLQSHAEVTQFSCLSASAGRGGLPATLSLHWKKALIIEKTRLSATQRRAFYWITSMPDCNCHSNHFSPGPSLQFTQFTYAVIFTGTGQQLPSSTSFIASVITSYANNSNIVTWLSIQGKSNIAIFDGITAKGLEWCMMLVKGDAIKPIWHSIDWAFSPMVVGLSILFLQAKQNWRLCSGNTEANCNIRILHIFFV